MTQRSPDTERLLSLAEVRGILGVSEATISRLLARGELTAVRIGRRTLVEPAEVRRFVESGRVGR